MNLIRNKSRGYKLDPPVLLHVMILVGAGEMLTPEFQKQWNISHVINCAEDEISPSWFKRNDNYIFLNAIDSKDVSILDWYPKFKETIQKFLRDPDCTRVFVHCQCGINRSMFLTLMFLCDVLGYNYESTERHIIQTRPCSLTNNVFRIQIKGALSKKGG
jgi:protein-tyrosine phosphatase